MQGNYDGAVDVKSVELDVARGAHDTVAIREFVCEVSSSKAGIEDGSCEDGNADADSQESKRCKQRDVLNFSFEFPAPSASVELSAWRFGLCVGITGLKAC